MIYHLAKRRYTVIDMFGQLGILYLIMDEHNFWYALMAIPLGLLTAYIDSIERVVNGLKK